MFTLSSTTFSLLATFQSSISIYPLVIPLVPGTLTKSETLNHMDELFSRALNGFMLVLSNDGNMIYLSENVSDYLGVSQVRLSDTKKHLPTIEKKEGEPII